MDIHVFAIDSPYNKTFVEFIARNFNMDDNLFISLCDKTAQTYPLPERDNILHIPTGNFGAHKKIHDFFTQAKRIFAHSLFEPALNLFATYPGQKKIMLIPWGSEMAPFIFRDINDRLDDRTRRFFSGDGPLIASRTYSQMAAEWELWRKTNLVLSKVSHLLHITNFNHQVLKQVFGKDLIPLPFQYYNPVDFSLLDREVKPANEIYHFKNRFKKVLQLAHSGNPANNHISIIDKLAELNRDDFCVIAPLSYGVRDAINRISDYGEEKLSGRFFPINEFLPPEQYAALLRQVDTLLINSFYSGGTANMTLMLHLGRKVMLSSRNISSHAVFKTYGINLPEIKLDDKHDLWLNDAFKGLDEETCQHNREQMTKMVSEERLCDMYAYLLSKTE